MERIQLNKNLDYGVIAIKLTFLMSLFLLGCSRNLDKNIYRDKNIEQIFVSYLDGSKIGNKIVNKNEYKKLLNLLDKKYLTKILRDTNSSNPESKKDGIICIYKVYRDGSTEEMTFNIYSKTILIGNSFFYLGGENGLELFRLLQKIAVEGKNSDYYNFLEKETYRIILKLYNSEVITNADSSYSIIFKDKIMRKVFLVYVNRIFGNEGVAKYRVPTQSGFIKNYYEFGVFIIAKLRHFNNNCSKEAIKINFDIENRTQLVKLIKQELDKMGASYFKIEEK